MRNFKNFLLASKILNDDFNLIKDCSLLTNQISTGPEGQKPGQKMIWLLKKKKYIVEFTCIFWNDNVVDLPFLFTKTLRNVARMRKSAQV